MRSRWRVAVCYVFDYVFSVGGVVGSSAYFYWSAGTSMAAPHVAGVAALLVGKHGKMKPSQLRSYLERGADDLGQRGNDPYYGTGRVNAIKALGLR
jgi:lantibiotic leader peptide-processing serine protease